MKTSTERIAVEGKHIRKDFQLGDSTTRVDVYKRQNRYSLPQSFVKIIPLFSAGSQVTDKGTFSPK